jgi:hypothetical protein
MKTSRLPARRAQGMWEFDAEKPTGPVMLQGDHGPVAFRNMTIKKVDLSK